MKTKFLIFVTVVLLSLKVGAQGMPVYDNTNFISLAKSLIESAKQTSQLLKTVEFLKKQKENLEKVANAIQQLQAVQKIAQNNQQLFNLVQNDLSEILGSPYVNVDEIENITASFTDILDNSLETVNFVEEILSNDYLKMTDSERAEILKQKEMESKQMVSQVKSKTKRYREIISFRKMQDKINNRETEY
ncbi:conjugal transfer protein [Subsaximicrobium wynnwilliamsii]|uniref:Conjugal transfer protein n=1 Tax=Subsaximicrobium wynnwilliamsii TaxID=291179 RepID=A0A5C6ZDM6_9FLAO|nr:conjugal transfer protein [Subsaximicrobium wynnwilliamsii]TXD81517.1 conjugal transfer protein [Subsaximicrobium wynnwilliamsii]TXD87183.1 conjugal transfer protein [Subsaximicrobium wynnwilliamsii]TXE00877.1 conjugal transfer protein [Subsaximicrobium wynnwilliamsii]